MKIRDVFGVIKTAATEFMNDDALTLAASLAFYSVLSLAPLLVIGVWIVSLFYRGDVQEQTVQQARDTIGPQGAEIVQTVLRNVTDTRKSTIAATLGFVTLLFSASGVFGQLQYSLNSIWNVKPKNNVAWWNWLRKRFWSLAMMLIIGAFFLTSIVAATALPALRKYLPDVFQTRWFWATVNQIIPLIVYIFLFAVIYKILPDVNMQWRDVWPGALITAGLFGIGRYFIGIYVGRSTTSSVYGAAGSLAVLLIWLYYSAVIFFFGAEITQALALARGHKITPSKYAESVRPGDTNPSK